VLEFFILTPLPGSADHKKLHLDGVEMERDLNRYDLVHVTTRHAQMSDAELRGIYLKAWDLYYTPKHVETVLRRAKTWGYDPLNMMWKLMSFRSPEHLPWWPALKAICENAPDRLEIGPGLPIESPLVFYPREAWGWLPSDVRFAGMYWRYRRISGAFWLTKRLTSTSRRHRSIRRISTRCNLYTDTRGSKTAVEKLRRKTKARAAHEVAGCGAWRNRAAVSKSCAI
jgi:hypothetical protein